MKSNETTVGAYANTPHLGMDELLKMAEQRVRSGENAYFVRQDIVNGYAIGFGSVNDIAITCACERGAIQKVGAV